MPKVHVFDSSGSAYDCCQCDESIETGDILVIPSEQVVGIADAWPIAVTANAGKLHKFDETGTFANYADGKLLPSVPAALEAIAKMLDGGFADAETIEGPFARFGSEGF